MWHIEKLSAFLSHPYRTANGERTCIHRLRFQDLYCIMCHAIKKNSISLDYSTEIWCWNIISKHLIPKIVLNLQFLQKVKFSKVDRHCLIFNPISFKSVSEGVISDALLSKKNQKCNYDHFFQPKWAPKI